MSKFVSKSTLIRVSGGDGVKAIDSEDSAVESVYLYMLTKHILSWWVWTSLAVGADTFVFVTHTCVGVVQWMCCMEWCGMR